MSRHLPVLLLATTCVQFILTVANVVPRLFVIQLFEILIASVTLAFAIVLCIQYYFTEDADDEGEKVQLKLTESELICVNCRTHSLTIPANPAPSNA